MEINKFPLYDDLKKLPTPVDYCPKKLSQVIGGLGPDNKNETGLHRIIHLLILHHYFVSTQNSFAKSKGILPYQAKTFDKNKGVLYQVDNLPEDLRVLIFKLLKITTDL